MTDYANAIQQQHTLQHALEVRIGRPADWPLKIQAAYQQLQTLHQLAGPDYNTFIRRAQQAVEERRSENSFSTAADRRTRLGTLLFGDSHQLPDTLQICWAMSIGLEVLLTNEEYETVINAAVEADQGATVAC
ncbi:hypothetical protein [Streptomyces filamentosus]|uniref:hypothetical protein n=1 Tax=Streptomyces filamentosus TaxID=67294 RepID=UPI0033F0FA00